MKIIFAIIDIDIIIIVINICFKLFNLKLLLSQRLILLLIALRILVSCVSKLDHLHEYILLRYLHQILLTLVDVVSTHVLPLNFS